MIWLIFANFIGDWGLQNRFMAENKGKYWEIMLAHSFIWAGCVSIALEYLGIFTIYKAIFLVLGHSVIDKWKCVYYKSEKDRWMLHLDQVAHILQLLIVFIY